MTGVSRNWPHPENSTISSKRRVISWRRIPSNVPLRNTFSRPVNSGWNPVPTSSRLPTRPARSARPRVGAVIRVRIFSRVDLPAPLRPMMPSAVPGATSKLTSASARHTSCSLTPMSRRPSGSSPRSAGPVRTPSLSWPMTRARSRRRRLRTIRSGCGATAGHGLGVLGACRGDPRGGRTGEGSRRPGLLRPGVGAGLPRAAPRDVGGGGPGGGRWVGRTAPPACL